MNEPEKDRLEVWSARLADGELIDWDAARQALPSAEFLRLKQLAELAGTMRRCSSSDRLIGERWGHLEIRELLGRGSFGEVMLAFDPILQREVALKLRRIDAPDARPEAWIDEARQLARLRHPNVLAVHGADIRNGVPGLWADRIDGSTLRDHVRARRLGFPGMLDVARQLAAAVAAVHRHGLVHGDVKPGNVMIEPDGRVILMDFGAARPQGGRGRSAGSPAVMSPERLAGGAPSRADDIHALGAVLAFLDGGHYPFVADSLDELRAVHDERAEPVVHAPGAPRAWRGLIRSMLDRNPSNRPSIDRVVDRLEWIRSAPGRRRRWFAIGSIFALLVAGLITALVAYVRVRDAESETSAVNSLLRDVLAAPRATELGREVRMVDVLERALPEAERRFADRPLALARVRALLGQTFESLGLPGDAEPLLRNALVTYEQRLGVNHRRTIDLLDPIARVESATGRLDDAEATWNRLLEQADPSTVHGRQEMIYAYVGLADLRRGKNRLDEALVELDRALALDLDAETGRAAQSVRSLKSLVLHRAGRLDEALALGRVALDESLRLNGSRHANTLIARDRLIQIQLAFGGMDAAERLARENLNELLDWLGEGERRTVMAQISLSNVLADQGRVEASLELLEQASRAAPEAFAPESPDPFVIDNNRAARYLELDRPEDAVALATELVDRLRTTPAPVGQLPWINALNRAEGLYWLERNEASREQAAEIRAEIVAAHGPGHPLAQIAASYEGAALLRLGRIEEATELLELAHAGLAATLGEDHPQVLMIAAWRAENQALAGEASEAVAAMQDVLDRAQAALAPNHYRLRDLGRIAERVASGESR